MPEANNARSGFFEEVARLPLFERLSDRIAELLKPEMIAYFNDHDVLMHQGEPPDYLIVLLHGSVRIEAQGIFLTYRHPYEVIGEQAFINGSPRSASVIAQGVVKALRIPRLVVEDLMRDIGFMRNLLLIVSDKLAESTRERAFHYRIERLLASEFRAHVAPEVLNRLLEEGKAYGSPHFTDAIVLLSDIRSFTRLSAAMSPSEIAFQLSPYLDSAVDVIHKHQGFVDKFIGDAVLAVWGFTPATRDPAELALSCAIELVKNASNHTFGGETLSVGVGVSAGNVFVGNIGGEGKRQFTILGTPANLAARYESKCKNVGHSIIMGGDFVERLPEATRKGLVEVPNQEIPGLGSQTLYSIVL